MRQIRLTLGAWTRVLRCDRSFDACPPPAQASQAAANSGSLPFLAEPHDALRQGLTTLKDGAVAAHPAELIQTSGRTHAEAARTQMLQNVYGSALPTRMMIDKHILGRCAGWVDSCRRRRFTFVAATSPAAEVPLIPLHHSVERLPGLPSSRVLLESYTGGW